MVIRTRHHYYIAHATAEAYGLLCTAQNLEAIVYCTRTWTADKKKGVCDVQAN